MMALGLVVLVAIDTFVSGYLLAHYMHVRQVLARLAGDVQSLGHDVDHLAEKVGGGDA